MDNSKMESNDPDRTSTKLAINDVSNKIKPSIYQNSVVPYFQQINIPNEILDLLWFADGPLKNFDLANRNKTMIKTKLFEFEINPEPEPSAIFTMLPINFHTILSPLDAIQMGPKYSTLTPDERSVYLKWLCNIEKEVDIGYVFLFYYGLERHLILGNYQKAVNIIFKLREYHDHHRFIWYSNRALILAALYHKDDATLIRVLDTLHDSEYSYDENDDRWILLAKYRLKLDLSSDDVLSFRSLMGSKMSNYIKDNYPVFKEYLIKELMREYGKPSFPFCNIVMNIPKAKESVFANRSIPGGDYLDTPSIKDSPQFQLAIYSILFEVNETVKQLPAKVKKEIIKKWWATAGKEEEDCNDNDHH